MQKFWSILAVRLGKHAAMVLVVAGVVTVILGFGIPKLEFATGQDSYLNEDEQVAIDNVAYQDLFGGQAMLSAISMDEGHTIDEIMTPEGIAAFKSFSEEVRNDDGVVAVISPYTALDFSNRLILDDPENPSLGGILTGIAATALNGARDEFEPGTADYEAREADIQATTLRVLGGDGGEAIPESEMILGNAEWNRFVLYDNAGEVRKALRPFFPDERHGLIITRLVGNQDIVAEGRAADVVAAASSNLRFPNATVTTSGAPELLKDLNDYLRGGMLTLGGIAVLMMIVILLVLFDVRWRLLPLGVVLIGVTWAFGLAGYLGIPLTIVTIAGLPVMLGVGIDYAIQMHSRIEEEVIVDRSDHPIQETARRLGPALLVVTFDAVFAFLALRFAKVPMIRDFGLLLAVGIAAICLCSIILPLSILGIREFRTPTQGRDYREGMLGRFVVKLGSLPPASAIPFAIGSILIFLGGIAVEGDLKIQSDPIQWVNQSSDTIKNIRTIEEETNVSSELGVFIQADDVFTDESVAYAHEFTRKLVADNPDLLVLGSSIETAVGDLLYLEGTTDVAPKGESVRAAWEKAPEDLQVSTASPDGDAMNVAFLARPGDLERRGDLVREIRADEEPPAGISLTPSGLVVVGVGLVDNLEANRILLTYLAILFVGLFLMVRLRSVIRSLLSLVPVLVAVGAASIGAWLAGFELSPMTAVGGPLVVAICTEFTSLILLRFVEERQRGLDPQEAADVAAARTGRAFIVSALTGIVGVAVLASSSLPLLRDFGLIVALNVVVALASALIILPPMLVWADRRNWVSRGLVHPDESYIETPPMGVDPH